MCRGDRSKQVAGTGLSKSRGQALRGCTRVLIPGTRLLIPAPATELVLVLLTLSLALGCSHAPPADTGPALGERFWLKAGESATIRGERSTVTFERIVSDSRCAVDVQCIRAGEARAAFRLKAGGAPDVSFELDTDRERTREVGRYIVTLHDVAPAPRSTVRIAPADYRAEITVSR